MNNRLLDSIDQLLSNSRIDKLDIGDLPVAGIDMLREDLIHPEISGNKLRKLKYNLLEAEKEGKDTILTFGGAFSNHIAATAAAGRLFGFKTIGVIRGDELNPESNDTLKKAVIDGMQLHFVSRKDYKLRNDENYLSVWKQKFPKAFFIPEGGSNFLGLKGCTEILKNDHQHYSHVICACGTGATLSGIINTLNINQKAIGISAVGGDFLTGEVQNFLKISNCNSSNWEVISSYNFDRYGKVIKPLIDFIIDFHSINNIFVEPIYTGKMLYGTFDLCQKGFFPRSSRILVLHTGGLQGWKPPVENNLTN